MVNCECCQKNEGTPREVRTLDVGTWQAGTIRKGIPTAFLCDACNDGRFPFYRETRDGERLSCPHGVAGAP